MCMCPLHFLFIVENKMWNHLGLCQQKFQNVFSDHSIHALTSSLYRRVIVFSQISFWSSARFIRVYNGSHELWCNSTLKTRSSDTSLLAEVALLLPLPPNPSRCPFQDANRALYFSEPPSNNAASCHWPMELPPLPLYISVRYIQQVQIRLLSNIHRVQVCGSPASAHRACLRKTVTEPLLSGVGLERDLAGHKYITASLNMDSSGGGKWMGQGIWAGCCGGL